MQNRQSLKVAGYKLVKYLPNDDALVISADGDFEVFQMNDHHSGWTLVIDGVGYEFVKSIKPSEVFYLL